MGRCEERLTPRPIREQLLADGMYNPPRTPEPTGIDTTRGTLIEDETEKDDTDGTATPTVGGAVAQGGHSHNSSSSSSSSSNALAAELRLILGLSTFDRVPYNP